MRYAIDYYLTSLFTDLRRNERIEGVALDDVVQSEQKYLQVERDGAPKPRFEYVRKVSSLHASKCACIFLKTFNPVFHL